MSQLFIKMLITARMFLSLYSAIIICDIAKSYSSIAYRVRVFIRRCSLSLCSRSCVIFLAQPGT